jgi:hypothetical protein
MSAIALGPKALKKRINHEITSLHPSHRFNSDTDRDMCYNMIIQTEYMDASIMFLTNWVRVSSK